MRLSHPDFLTIGTWMWYRCQPYAPPALPRTSRDISWYLFQSEAESIPGPYCGWKDKVNEKLQWPHWTHDIPACRARLNQLCPRVPPALQYSPEIIIFNEITFKKAALNSQKKISRLLKGWSVNIVQGNSHCIANIEWNTMT